MKSFTPMLTFEKKVLFGALDSLVFMASVLLVSLSVDHVVVNAFLLTQVFLLALVSLIAQYIFGNYDLDYVSSRKDFLQRQLFSVLFTLFVVMGANYLVAGFTHTVFSPAHLLTMAILFSAIVCSYKVFVIQIFNTIRTKAKWLVVADTKTLNLFKEEFAKIDFDGSLQFASENLPDYDLKNLLKQELTTVILGSNVIESNLTLKAQIEALKKAGTNIISATEFYERHLLKIPVHIIDSNWFNDEVGIESLKNPTTDRIKRLTDVVLAIVIGAITLPLIIITYFIVKLDSNGPAFYTQLRTGENNKVFKIFKFRSMKTDAEINGVQWAAQNDPRITRIGHILRKTRIDELPQLWNILKGDMSFVGPRPERPEFNEKLQAQLPHYQLRHAIKPGLTGWAQVMYPYGASVEDSKEKLQYELYYMKNRSFFQDMAIILKTVAVVINAMGR